jgi:hypothetical protein
MKSHAFDRSKQAHLNGGNDMIATHYQKNKRQALLFIKERGIYNYVGEILSFCFVLAMSRHKKCRCSFPAQLVRCKAEKIVFFFFHNSSIISNVYS